jgi:hypothetical protein
MKLSDKKDQEFDGYSTTLGLQSGVLSLLYSQVVHDSQVSLQGFPKQ